MRWMISRPAGRTDALFGLIQSEANAIAQGTAAELMTPTILLRDGKLSFVTGSPGGPAIISATLLSVINWMRLVWRHRRRLMRRGFIINGCRPDFYRRRFSEGTRRLGGARICSEAPRA